MSIINKINSLYGNSGPSLFLIRLPFRIFKYVINRINTQYYRFFCLHVGHSSIIEFGVHIEAVKNVSIGENVYISRGVRIVSENSSGILTINDRVHIGNNCHIDHTGDVLIGDDTLFSENVLLYSHSHGKNPRSMAVPMNKNIGKGCWFGVNSIILEGATKINDGTVLAAGGIITKSALESNGIYVGIPARKLK